MKSETEREGKAGLTACISRKIALVGMLSAAFLAGCGQGDSAQEEKLESLSRIDFRPNSEFGFDAAILGLRLGKQVIDERMPEDGVDKAEGYRFLFRLVEMNLNSFSGDHDPAHPQISRCPSRMCKLGLDNPDYSYVGTSPISAEYNYRLYGKRGSSPLILFQVLERGTGAFVGTSKTDSDKLHVDENGNWEVFLGTEKPAGVPEGNFLKLEKDQATLVMRIVSDDWNKAVEPSVNIEVLDRVEGGAELFTPMRMARTGFILSRIIPSQVERWVRIVREAPLNAVDKPCQGWASGCGEGGFGNFSAGGRFTLEEDEALIIEVPEVDTSYQNIQLTNIWGESMDYATRQTSLNEYQSATDDDGVRRYVIAHKDPGVPNWLDASGHKEGGIFMRWVNPADHNLLKKPETKVVAVEEVRRHLPEGTPRVSELEREQVLKRRLQGYNRRTNPANLWIESP